MGRQALHKVNCIECGTTLEIPQSTKEFLEKTDSTGLTCGDCLDALDWTA